jgi:hypothetical protein
MKKEKVYLIVLVSVAVILFALQVKKEWALQMSIAGIFLMIILFIRYKGPNFDFLSTIADYSSILFITFWPSIINGLTPHLIMLSEFAIKKTGLDWVSIDLFENLSFVIFVALFYG